MPQSQTRLNYYDSNGVKNLDDAVKKKELKR